MRPQDMQIIGAELALKWPDGAEQFIPLESLRRGCPCAGCAGEMDVMGRVHRGPAQALGERAFQLTRWLPVGGYGVQLVWADGHNTGICSWEFLRGFTADPPDHAA